jgi:hypothetical protein
MLFTLAPSHATQPLTIATATTGGTFYPVGVAVASLINKQLSGNDNLAATAIATAGSAENVKMLRDNQCDLAIIQALYGAVAYEGKIGCYADKPMKNMSAITMLWQNVEHFVLRSEFAKTGNITDLKGLNQGFSIGKKNSGSSGSGRTIIRALDILLDKDFDTRYLGYTPATEAMINNQIAGANIPGGVPIPAVTSLFSTLQNKVTILSFTPQQLEQINRHFFDVWTAYTIPTGSYPHQDQPIQTISQPNLLVASNNLSQDAVYKVTKTIYKNLPFLHNCHPATLAMSLEKALDGVPMPLHPGALKYYREMGLTIPDKLLGKH